MKKRKLVQEPGLGQFLFAAPLVYVQVASRGRQTPCGHWREIRNGSARASAGAQRTHAGGCRRQRGSPAGSACPGPPAGRTEARPRTRPGVAPRRWTAGVVVLRAAAAAAAAATRASAASASPRTPGGGDHVASGRRRPRLAGDRCPGPGRARRGYRCRPRPGPRQRLSGHAGGPRARLRRPRLMDGDDHDGLVSCCRDVRMYKNGARVSRRAKGRTGRAADC